MGCASRQGFSGIPGKRRGTALPSHALAATRLTPFAGPTSRASAPPELSLCWYEVLSWRVSAWNDLAAGESNRKMLVRVNA